MTNTKRYAAGFSLIEALIALAITATVATLAIGVLINQNPKSQQSYGRSASDFIGHLGTVCKKSHAEYGRGPLAATTIDTASCPGANCNVYAFPKAIANRVVGTHDSNLRGFSWLIKDWESTVTYNSGDESLSYPEGIRLYLQPDMSNAASNPDVDPNTQIPDDASGIAGTGYNPENALLIPGTLNDIMYNTTPNPDVASDDRQFVILDMNGTSGPNSIVSTGDRVLLYVEDKTCRIRTAYQACRDQGMTLCTQSATYGQSFYDVYKCTEATTMGYDSSHCATAAGNYDADK